jgi:hypothetical protein
MKRFSSKRKIKKLKSNKIENPPKILRFKIYFQQKTKSWFFPFISLKNCDCKIKLSKVKRKLFFEIVKLNSREWNWIFNCHWEDLWRHNSYFELQHFSSFPFFLWIIFGSFTAFFLFFFFVGLFLFLGHKIWVMMSVCCLEFGEGEF